MKVYDFEGGRHLLVLRRGDDILKSMNQFARDRDIRAALLQGIGAADVAKLGQYNYEAKDYRVVELRGALEVVSLIGNISLRDGVPFTHAHITVTTQEGHAFGGHLLEGTRSALTMEIGVQELGAGLERRLDPRFNLGVLYDVE